MRDPHEEDLPDALEPLAARLRACRADADPLLLDRIKRRVMAQSNPAHRRGTLMKSRIATLLTILGLLGVTSGALALAGGRGLRHNAASSQYVPGKGCGDKNHTHTGPPGNPANTSCPPQSNH
jgi:hypothetical protein